MTTNNTTKTVSPALISEKFAEFQEAKKAVEAAQTALNDKIKELKATLGATFAHEGQLYQVRVRGSVPYIVPLKCEPTQWHQEARAKRLAEAAARVEEAATVASVEDTVIDMVADEEMEITTEELPLASGDDITLG